ncbi:RNA polymerase sigma-70 factor [Pedobacter nyackensis]|uniref:RNA polymerase sigma-70 factor n=1 Tax=Pedobacter nyackensis TaxID=475255 RepID=UPI002931B21F|nr:RNA polymerase sigma-70 factor [Pedobacter nyackensis]
MTAPGDKTLITIDQFEVFFHKNYKGLCMLAVHYVKDADLAKDLVQEFFLYVWNKREQINFQSTFEAYAHRSVKNICITYLKRQKNHVLFQSEELPDLSFDPDEIIAEELFQSEMISKLKDAIKNLPPERRKLFLMSNVQGYTYAEIAKRNNISINTVKTQIKKAYATLRL